MPLSTVVCRNNFWSMVPIAWGLLFLCTVVQCENHWLNDSGGGAESVSNAGPTGTGVAATGTGILQVIPVTPAGTGILQVIPVAAMTGTGVSTLTDYATVEPSLPRFARRGDVVIHDTSMSLLATSVTSATDAGPTPTCFTDGGISLPLMESCIDQTTFAPQSRSEDDTVSSKAIGETFPTYTNPQIVKTAQRNAQIVPRQSTLWTTTSTTLTPTTTVTTHVKTTENVTSTVTIEQTVASGTDSTMTMASSVPSASIESFSLSPIPGLLQSTSASSADPSSATSSMTATPETTFTTTATSSTTVTASSTTMVSSDSTTLMSSDSTAMMSSDLTSTSALPTSSAASTTVASPPGVTMSLPNGVYLSTLTNGEVFSYNGFTSDGVTQYMTQLGIVTTACIPTATITRVDASGMSTVVGICGVGIGPMTTADIVAGTTASGSSADVSSVASTGSSSVASTSGTSASPSSSVADTKTATSTLQTSAAVQSGSFSLYTVTSGDVGVNIASELGIPFTAITLANPTITSWPAITPGQTIYIPLPPTASMEISSLVPSTSVSTDGQSTSTATGTTDSTSVNPVTIDLSASDSAWWASVQAASSSSAQFAAGDLSASEATTATLPTCTGLNPDGSTPTTCVMPPAGTTEHASSSAIASGKVRRGEHVDPRVMSTAKTSPNTASVTSTATLTKKAIGDPPITSLVSFWEVSMDLSYLESYVATIPCDDILEPCLADVEGMSDQWTSSSTPQSASVSTSESIVPTASSTPPTSTPPTSTPPTSTPPSTTSKTSSAIASGRFRKEEHVVWAVVVKPSQQEGRTKSGKTPRTSRTASTLKTVPSPGMSSSSSSSGVM